MNMTLMALVRLTDGISTRRIRISTVRRIIIITKRSATTFPVDAQGMSPSTRS